MLIGVHVLILKDQLWDFVFFFRDIISFMEVKEVTHSATLLC